jgi:hypothetical protein
LSADDPADITTNCPAHVVSFCSTYYSTILATYTAAIPTTFSAAKFPADNASNLSTFYAAFNMPHSSANKST